MLCGCVAKRSPAADAQVVDPTGTQADGISEKLLEGYSGLSALSGAELESFVAAEWAGLQRQGNVFSELPRTSSYYHRGGVAGTVLHEDGSRAAPEPPAGPWWHGWEGRAAAAPPGETLFDTMLGMSLGQSASGRQVGARA